MAKRARTALTAGAEESGNVPIVRTIPYNHGLKRIHLLFHSDDRDFGTAERPGFFLTGFGNAIKHAHVSVRNVTVPMTFYPVDENSGVFVWTSGVSGTVTITLEPGWYTASTLAAEIESKLQDAGDPSTMKVYAYDATNNPYFNSTGALLFKSTTTPASFSFEGANASTSDYAHRLLGFAPSTVYSATGSNPYTLTPPYVCDVLAGMRSIDVGCTLGPPHYWDSIDNQIRRTIERVPLPSDAQFGDVLVHQPPNMSEFIVEDFSQTASVQFDLTDNRDLPIDLNGAGWAIELIVDPVDV
jgi:hypothetical protein